jgi:hypothetical protein
VNNWVLVLKRYALAREILRCAQDDGKKTSGARVILSESCCSEESRRRLRRPALVRHISPAAAVSIEKCAEAPFSLGFSRVSEIRAARLSLSAVGEKDAPCGFFD